MQLVLLLYLSVVLSAVTPISYAADARLSDSYRPNGQNNGSHILDWEKNFTVTKQDDLYLPKVSDGNWTKEFFISEKKLLVLCTDEGIKVCSIQGHLIKKPRQSIKRDHNHQYFSHSVLADDRYAIVPTQDGWITYDLFSPKMFQLGCKKFSSGKLVSAFNYMADQFVSIKDENRRTIVAHITAGNSIDLYRWNKGRLYHQQTIQCNKPLNVYSQKPTESKHLNALLVPYLNRNGFGSISYSSEKGIYEVKDYPQELSFYVDTPERGLLFASIKGMPDLFKVHDVTSEGSFSGERYLKILHPSHARICIKTITAVPEEPYLLVLYSCNETTYLDVYDAYGLHRISSTVLSDLYDLGIIGSRLLVQGSKLIVAAYNTRTKSNFHIIDYILCNIGES